MIPTISQGNVTLHLQARSLTYATDCCLRSWSKAIDSSRWLHHISAIIKSALVAVHAIDAESRPVLVHCSDGKPLSASRHCITMHWTFYVVGWDRTPQIVALAELMLDPHYRTMDGFETLINREWIEFGHKFGDRTGISPTNEDPNERCPVFLQWLGALCNHSFHNRFPRSIRRATLTPFRSSADCVHQIVKQHPNDFEFNLQYLVSSCALMFADHSRARR